MDNGNGSRLTNKEKSARRYASLTAFAIGVAKKNPKFLEFCGSMEEVTWRRLETFIKQNYEAGAEIEIVIKSGEDGGK